MKTTLNEPARIYPTTFWSEVNRAGGSDSETSLTALEDLLQKYYQPLRCHLAFKFSVSDDQAAEWLQGFLHKKVMLDKLLSHASEARGRFRTFLLNSLDNFVFDELRKANRQRRNPSGGFASIEELAPDEQATLVKQADDRFAAGWASAVVEQTEDRMRVECERDGQLPRWGVFKARVLDPMLDGVEPMPYEELISRFGFRSPAEASNVLITAKRMFHRVLRQVVSEYAGEQADVEAEIRDLRIVLAAAR